MSGDKTALEDFRWEIRRALRDLKRAPDRTSALLDLEEEIERASDTLDTWVNDAIDDDGVVDDDDVSENARVSRSRPQR